MPLTLDQLGAAGSPLALLEQGIYEHSPWIAQATWAQRPFQSLAHLKHALAQTGARSRASSGSST